MSRLRTSVSCPHEVFRSPAVAGMREMPLNLNLKTAWLTTRSTGPESNLRFKRNPPFQNSDEKSWFAPPKLHLCLSAATLLSEVKSYLWGRKWDSNQSHRLVIKKQAILFILYKLLSVGCLHAFWWMLSPLPLLHLPNTPALSDSSSRLAVPNFTIFHLSDTTAEWRSPAGAFLLWDSISQCLC